MKRKFAVQARCNAHRMPAKKYLQAVRLKIVTVCRVVHWFHTTQSQLRVTTIYPALGQSQSIKQNSVLISKHPCIILNDSFLKVIFLCFVVQHSVDWWFFSKTKCLSQWNDPSFIPCRPSLPRLAGMELAWILAYNFQFNFKNIFFYLIFFNFFDYFLDYLAYFWVLLFWASLNCFTIFPFAFFARQTRDANTWAFSMIYTDKTKTK